MIFRHHHPKGPAKVRGFLRLGFPRWLLTIRELSVPDVFSPACRTRNSGLFQQGQQKHLVLQILSDSRRWWNTEREPDQQPSLERHQLCRPLPASLPDRKHLLSALLLKHAPWHRRRRFGSRANRSVRIVATGIDAEIVSACADLRPSACHGRRSCLQQQENTNDYQERRRDKLRPSR